MGNALRLHPLLVIFGLLAGGEIYGLPGVARRAAAARRRPRDLGVLLGAADTRAVGRRAAADARIAGARSRSASPISRRRRAPARMTAARSRARGRAPLRSTRALRTDRPRARRRRGGRARRAERRRQVDAARAARRRARAERRHRRARARRRLGAAAAGALRPALGAREPRALRAARGRARRGRRRPSELLARFDAAGRAAAAARALGRQPAAAERRARAARRRRRCCCSTSRPRRSTPVQRRRALGDRARRCASAGGAVVLRDAEPRGDRARGSGARAARRTRRALDSRRGSPLSAVALLLRKDLLVLRRSPLLLGVLLAYPLVIALLVGLVAGYASSKPRVAFVDEDNLPDRRAGRGPAASTSQTTIDEVSQNVTLVPLSADEARRELAIGPGGRDDHRAAGIRRRPRDDGREPEPRSCAPAPARSRRASPAGAGARLPAQPPAAGRLHQGESRLRAADPARRQRQLPRPPVHRARARPHREAARDAAAVAARDDDPQLHPRPRAPGSRGRGRRCRRPRTRSSCASPRQRGEAGCSPRRCRRTESR